MPDVVLESITPPGRIALSPASQPIFTFIEAANQIIQGEYARIHQLHRYAQWSAGPREEWMRLHEEHQQQILTLGPLGAEAIRAGRLAGETVRTGELVQEVKDCIRSLQGWIGRWWERHGDDYRRWHEKWLRLSEERLQLHKERIVKNLETGEEVPPEFIDDALPLIELASKTMCDLTNCLHIIAIGVPVTDSPQRDAGSDLPDSVAERRIKLMLALAQLLLIGPNAKRIAQIIGVPRSTLLGWPTFREKYDLARAKQREEKEERRKRLRDGDTDSDET